MELLNGLPDVVDIEVLEDVSAKPLAQRHFLELRRLRCRNRRSDGSTSAEFPVDVVERPTLDAVAVLLYRRTPQGVEVLTRKTLRPAAYFRRGKQGVHGTEAGMLKVEELVAGVLEPGEQGDAALVQRAVEEAREEAGLLLEAAQVKSLGAPFFLAAGILSEQIHLLSADCTGAESVEPATDGSPLEEAGELRWTLAPELLARCRRGEVQDAKTEVALGRFLFP